VARDRRRSVLVLLLNVAAVLFMVGFIWTMQLVHYPFFDRVGEEAFPSYETAHNRLFFLVAGPRVLGTLVTGVLLLFVRPQLALGSSWNIDSHAAPPLLEMLLEWV
jgi:uncharacterized membrane protein